MEQERPRIYVPKKEYLENPIVKKKIKDLKEVAERHGRQFPKIVTGDE